jgi:hypothetical protein
MVYIGDYLLGIYDVFNGQNIMNNLKPGDKLRCISVYNIDTDKLNGIYTFVTYKENRDFLVVEELLGNRAVSRFVIADPQPLTGLALFVQKQKELSICD